MIRLAKVPDIWRKVDRNSYRYYVEKINLNGVLGIQEPIDFRRGIFAICGLNGVGKSTIFAALKDILGMNIRNQDKIRLNEIEVHGSLKDGKNSIEIKNKEGERLKDILGDEIFLEDIDYLKLIEVNVFLEQPNLIDLIEQHDDNVFLEEDLKALSYLVGKTYDSVTLRELEVEDDKVVPYFQIECNGLKYDSLKMGTGEHFLFYVYWLLKRFTTNGIILIEEPEIFISVNSQKNLMNFIAAKMNEHKFSVILISHSPFILQNINQSGLVVLRNYLNNVDVVQTVDKEEILEELGLIVDKKGVFVFEDLLALEFFKSICKRHAPFLLRNFEVDKTNGKSDITKILSSPKLSKVNYKLIGIYDGDVKHDETIDFDALNWKYSFLPGEISLEEEFQKLTRQYFDELCQRLQLSDKELRGLLGKVQGMEYHDWLMELAKSCHKDFNSVVDVFYVLWEIDNLSSVEIFLTELEIIISA